MTKQGEMDRIVEAYVRMAKTARYRPAAPGDGMGSVDLTKKQRADEDLLLSEARRYAARFIQEEDTRSFHIGCSKWETDRAVVYAIEAARVLCGALNDDLAVELLTMAAEEVKTHGRRVIKRFGCPTESFASPEGKPQ
jgi:hypothetical protein